MSSEEEDFLIKSRTSSINSFSLNDHDSKISHTSDKWEHVRIRCSILAALVAFFAICGSAAYIPAMPDIQKDLNASDFQMTLTLVGPTTILAFGPLLAGPCSDRFGRRLLVLLSIGFFGAVLICAGSINIWILIIGRTLSYVFCCGYTSICTAIVTEIYPISKRATAIGGLIMPSFFLTIIIPPISGILVHYFGWRAAFWLLIIPAFFTMFLLYFFLPETVDLKGKKRPINPIKTFGTLTKFPLSGIIACNAFAFVAMIMVSANFSLLISSYYPYGSTLIGIMYMPYGLGSLLGSIIGGRISDKLQKLKGIGGSILTQIIFSLFTCFAAILFGWSVPYSPIIAVIASSLSSFGAVSSRSAVFSIGVQCNPGQAAGATAALVCFQFILSVPELFITGILLDRIHPGYIYSMWGFLVILFLPLSLYSGKKYWNIYEIKQTTK